MNIEIKTSTIEPIRHTFDHVAARIGGDKLAPRYLEGTLQLQSEANFHYRPMWDREGFALADSYDPDTGRYRGLILPTEATHTVITNTTLLVKPEVALQQREQDSAHRGTDPGPDSKSGGHRSGGGAGPQPAGGGEVRGPVSPPAARPKPGPSRYFAVKTLREDLYAKDFKDLADEVLLHLRSQPGATVTVRVEIEANHPGGYPEHIVRTVSENATTLKFDQSGFETD